jgi:hypothetical protein
VSYRNWKEVEKAVDDYIQDYEFDDDNCYHIPTESERILLKDCAMGLLSDDAFIVALRAVLAIS